MPPNFKVGLTRRKTCHFHDWVIVDRKRVQTNVGRGTYVPARFKTTLVFQCRECLAEWIVHNVKLMPQFAYWRYLQRLEQRALRKLLRERSRPTRCELNSYPELDPPKRRLRKPGSALISLACLGWTLGNQQGVRGGAPGGDENEPEMD